MKIYQVGGSIRDELLGLPVADRDWVVVGASPQKMLDAGYKPVGRDFPVFLHPSTHEEYALARTERKTAPGYKGFAFHSAPDVTLEEDLARRDFTVNAMAREREEAGAAPIIDPYGGRADLATRVLRHVSPSFAEDPVRILRAARFVARFGFAVAAETMALMRDMSANGEVDALVAERVWQEISRGLMEASPRSMFALLSDCGALARIAPELTPFDLNSAAMLALAAAARRELTLPQRFAALCANLSLELVSSVCERWRTPAQCRDLAMLAARNREALLTAASLDAVQLSELVRRCDGLRQPGRFGSLIEVSAAVAAAMAGDADPPDLDRARSRLIIALDAVRAVDAGKIAATAKSAAEIPRLLQAAQLHAVADALDRLPVR